MNALSTQTTPIGLETMSVALPKAINYHRWIYQSVGDFVGDRVLEIGSGSGNLSQFMLNRERLILTDLAEDSLALLRDRFGDRPNVRIEFGDVTDSALVDIAVTEYIDTVLSSNVLEHIENDMAALGNMRRMLPTGGHLLLIVPAMQWLYGTMDSTAGHFRRYETDAIVSKVTGLFKPNRVFYVNMVGALGWFINGRVLKQRNLSADSISSQVVLFDRIVVPVIQRLENLIDPPFGQSLVAILKAC
jgi:ubiquinone/menaquinone biosynthesis C-methylase UbiE